MTVAPETHLRARLLASASVSALVGDRIEPSASSETTTLPRVVYSRFSADHHHHHGGGAGLVFYRIQYDVFATSQEQMDAVGEALRNRLDGFRGPITTGAESRFFGLIRLEIERDEPVPPTDGSDQILYRRSLDFFVSCEEPIPSLTA